MRRIVFAGIAILITSLLSSLFGWQSLERDSADQAASLGFVSIAYGQLKTDANKTYPALSGRVVDAAGLLNANEKALLESRLAAFEERSSDQVVVATIATLDGENLEDYANQLFRYWQLGQANENNGVLLLVARDERKLRIEVGYGLEGTLTDAISKTIIDLVIVPKFRAGEFGAGIVEGAGMIEKVLSGDMAELEARKSRNPTSNDGSELEFWIFMSLWAALFLGPMLFAILAPYFGTKIGKRKYRWLGIETSYGSSSGGGHYSGSSSSGGWSGGGGFSGGGGSWGGGGASGGW